MGALRFPQRVSSAGSGGQEKLGLRRHRILCQAPTHLLRSTTPGSFMQRLGVVGGKVVASSNLLLMLVVTGWDKGTW